MAEGPRLYAIGDVHGRLDLLRALLAAIARDDRMRGRADTQVVLLGDLIDREPGSAAVIEYLRAFRPPFARLHFIMGNHEEVMLASLGDDAVRLKQTGWFQHGGWETLKSYDVPSEVLHLPETARGAAIARHVPRAHLSFIEGFANSSAIGDYLFVHAGIRPSVPLAEQTAADMLWICEPFLGHRRAHPLTVVHGHSIVAGQEYRPNRIAIDTGAWTSGVLTALGLEGVERWTLDIAEPPAQSEV